MYTFQWRIQKFRKKEGTLYDKQDDLNFSIVISPYLHVCSNIVSSPACGVYISQHSRQSTDKQVDVTGVSSVSFAGNSPQILWFLQPSNLPIQPFFEPHAVWYASYQTLSRSYTLILTTVRAVYLIWK
jgi:hypothetical protein